MKEAIVYIVEETHDYEPGTIIGVFTTLDKALESIPESVDKVFRKTEYESEIIFHHNKLCYGYNIYIKELDK